MTSDPLTHPSVNQTNDWPGPSVAWGGAWAKQTRTRSHYLRHVRSNVKICSSRPYTPIHRTNISVFLSLSPKLKRWYLPSESSFEFQLKHDRSHFAKYPSPKQGNDSVSCVYVTQVYLSRLTDKPAEILSAEMFHRPSLRPSLKLPANSIVADW